MEDGLAVIVLAGGTSRRLGPSKSLEKVGERSLLAHAVKAALTISPKVVVVAGNRQQEVTYGRELPAQVPIVHDKINHRGPLIGLYTGLESIDSEYAAVLPCDSPFVKREVVLYLYDVAKGMDAAVPVWGDGKIEPLHSVFRAEPARKAAVEAMKAELDTIREMIQHMDKVELVPMEKIKELDSALLTFFNINTKEDLERARTIWLETACAR